MHVSLSETILRTCPGLSWPQGHMQITVHMMRSNIGVLVVPSYDGIHSVRETLLRFGLPDLQSTQYATTTRSSLANIF
jgi:hypothetical protein